MEELRDETMTAYDRAPQAQLKPSMKGLAATENQHRPYCIAESLGNGKPTRAAPIVLYISRRIRASVLSAIRFEQYPKPHRPQKSPLSFVHA